MFSICGCYELQQQGPITDDMNNTVPDCMKQKNIWKGCATFSTTQVKTALTGIKFYKLYAGSIGECIHTSEFRWERILTSHNL
jgi:hypothetical protein